MWVGVSGEAGDRTATEKNMKRTNLVKKRSTLRKKGGATKVVATVINRLRKYKEEAAKSIPQGRYKGMLTWRVTRPEDIEYIKTHPGHAKLSYELETGQFYIGNNQIVFVYEEGADPVILQQQGNSNTFKGTKTYEEVDVDTEIES
jgi:hypothetical protein